MRTTEQVKEMYELQEATNTQVSADWRNQGFNYYRATWVECAELMDNLDYKWWKQMELDLKAARMEMVDIFHFILAVDLTTVKHVNRLDDGYFELIAKRFQSLNPVQDDGEESDAWIEGIRGLTDSLAFASLNKNVSTMFIAFTALMQRLGMSFDDLYKHYIGKNALNEFRQANGYNEGCYHKEWLLPIWSYGPDGKAVCDPMEDNEVLEQIIQDLPPETPDARTTILAELGRLYEHRIFDR